MEMQRKIKPMDAPDVLLDIVSAGLVPMLHGSPGMSKSDLVYQFCEKHNLELRELHLSMCDPVDIQGFPVRDGNKMSYVPLDIIPLGEDKPEKGKKGFCLFLDEANSAVTSVQAAAYKLVLRRMAGNHKLHPDTVIILAGNLSTDRAIVNRLSTAMQSRLIHIEIELDLMSWLKWANANNIDHRIISFIKARSNLLSNFDPKHNDYTFACGRTWFFLSKYITKKATFTSNDITVMAGTVSYGVANEFNLYCKIYPSMPTLDQIEADPEGFPIKAEPDVQYALTTMISHGMTAQNMGALMKATRRLPIEFQVVLIRDVFSKSPDLKSTKEIDDWVEDYGDKLY